ncbi:hypothetical protein K3495_g6618 [Podosphaera aphanis]|nr:hypothetical protein K3495_g6618 [Podosphaera aphanis]
MKVSQAYYEKHTNRHRIPPPSYCVGDKVFVNAKNIRTKRPCKKLDWKNLGPFTIVKVAGSYSYQLKLTEDLKSVHPVFHTSLLRPDPNNPIPGQTNEPNLPVEIDTCGESLYEVDAILDPRKRKPIGFEYLIKYTGGHDISWQPLSDVVNGNLSEALQKFHSKYPRRPKPTTKDIAESQLAAKAS